MAAPFKAEAEGTQFQMLYRLATTKKNFAHIDFYPRMWS